eukprot:TRINITY_DN5414_c0_g1_i1.p1 TRINITY_DN5414_c0_g1~~TRINITY_DN5414_c0_g1_i1.p1  ORF type:complete len:420 (+),score=46.77 TRINITY_DN5414_c0_g1_i1:45-1262(+)
MPTQLTEEEITICSRVSAASDDERPNGCTGWVVSAWLKNCDNVISMQNEPKGLAYLTDMVTTVMTGREVRSLVQILNTTLVQSEEGCTLLKALTTRSSSTSAVILSDYLKKNIPRPTLPYQESLSTWASTQPGHEECIIAYDKATSSYLRLPMTRVFHTVNSSKWATQEGIMKQTPAVCCNYHTNGCKARDRCNMIHVASEVLGRLRPPTCCGHHGAETVGDDDGDVTICQDGEVIGKVPAKHFAFSAGYRCLGPDRITTAKHICNQHQKEACGRPATCRFVHLCREVWREMQAQIPKTVLPIGHLCPEKYAEMALDVFLAKNGLLHLFGPISAMRIYTTTALHQLLKTCHLGDTVAPQEKRRLKNIFKYPVGPRSSPVEVHKASCRKEFIMQHNPYPNVVADLY